MLLLVTPTLGESPYLGETLRSIEECGLDVFHVIVCPPSVLDSFRQQWPDTFVVADDGKGRGMYGAINTGIQKAADVAWDWFTFINDDDLLFTGFADMYRSACADSFGDAAVLYGDVNLISSEGDFLYRCPVARLVSSVVPLWRSGVTPFMQQGSMVRRDWVERLAGFDDRYRYAGDMDFWCRAAKDGAKHAYCPELVAGFRIRLGQLSSDQEDFADEKVDIRRRHFGVTNSGWASSIHLINFRLGNIPSYVNRFSRHGMKRASQFLAK